MKIRWSACITALCLVFLVSGMPVDTFAREFEREEAFEGDPTGGFFGGYDGDQYGGNGGYAEPNVTPPIVLPFFVVGVNFSRIQQKVESSTAQKKLLNIKAPVDTGLSGLREFSMVGCSR